MRGSRECGLCRRVGQGIIPAGAGLTKCRGYCMEMSGDHPRGCGAHASSGRFLVRPPGSSPRVRGSLSNYKRAILLRGIIPAGAGLTRNNTSSLMESWDHPRGCGAHMGIGTAVLLAQGSSPRVRGSLTVHWYTNRSAGIIPAGAGLTTARPYWNWRTGDHPRGCGAHELINYELQQNKGSSPRVRGSLTLDWYYGTYKGIIPAGAGLTSLRG